MNSRERILAAIKAVAERHHATQAVMCGYILAPCHNLQSLTPIENIVAMYDEAWIYGK